MLKTYSEIISNISHRCDNEPPLKELLLWKNEQKKLECFYAPFEYVNYDAKIILVGITPGGTQMNRALNAASKSIANNENIEEAIRLVKKEGSFSGSMRANIINTLNRIGCQQTLGVTCSSKLWSTDNNLVQFCSLLKYPVFVKGKDYNGTPKPFSVPELEQLVHQEFVQDLALINSDAILIPLGDMVASVILELDKQGLIPQKILKFEGKIVAPPHPSGANAESRTLLLEANYPKKEEYQERMYQEYLRKKPWLKKEGRKPQTEEKYKKARAARWESMLFVRQAYELS